MTYSCAPCGPLGGRHRGPAENTAGHFTRYFCSPPPQDSNCELLPCWHQLDKLGKQQSFLVWKPIPASLISLIDNCVYYMYSGLIWKIISTGSFDGKHRVGFLFLPIAIWIPMNTISFIILWYKLFIQAAFTCLVCFLLQVFDDLIAAIPTFNRLLYILTTYTHIYNLCTWYVHLVLSEKLILTSLGC